MLMHTVRLRINIKYSYAVFTSYPIRCVIYIIP